MSRSPKDTRFPTVDDTFTAMRLGTDAWQRRRFCPITLTATGPEGQSATVTDNVFFLQRLT